MGLNCSSCGEDTGIDGEFANAGNEFECPKCNSILQMCYDEFWDSETFDEWGYFYFESVTEGSVRGDKPFRKRLPA
jgi:hypothetical protein